MSEPTPKELMSRGYRRTSNAFGMVSRIDRADWKEYMVENNFPVNADFYRRICSKDTLTIGKSKARRVKASGHDTTGFVE